MLNESNDTVGKRTCCTSPRMNGVSPSDLKSLGEAHRKTLFKFTKECVGNQSEECEELARCELAPLPKKGDLIDLKTGGAQIC